jgi:hypothetical protein
MANREKPKAIVTPAGVAKYANISKPKLNFKKTGDEYSVDMLFEPDDIKDFEATLKTLALAAKDKAVAEAKNGRDKKVIGDFEIYLPISEELEKESGDPTGKVIVKAKNSASYERDGVVQKRSMPVFDSKGKPVTGLNIGRGSTLKISVVPNTFVNPATKKVGVSLWLKAVQVIDLVEYGGGDAGSFGFGEEDGSYRAAEENAAAAAADDNQEF